MGLMIAELGGQFKFPHGISVISQVEIGPACPVMRGCLVTQGYRFFHICARFFLPSQQRQHIAAVGIRLRIFRIFRDLLVQDLQLRSRLHRCRGIRSSGGQDQRKIKTGKSGRSHGRGRVKGEHKERSRWLVHSSERIMRVRAFCPKWRLSQ